MNFCLICLTTNEDLIPMLKILNGNAIEVLENGLMYENCFGIELCEFSNCSALCVSCQIQLKYFDQFKKKALESLAKLPLIDVVHDIKEESDSKCSDNDDCQINEDEHLIQNNSDFFHVEYLESDDDDNNYKSDYSIKEQIEISFAVDAKNAAGNKRIASRKKFKHSCKICNRNFNTDGTYEAHMNTHKGLPPYQCSECGKSFNGKVNYEYHMKHHKNERNYKCEICGKTYLGKWDLKLHMKVHSDDRPFICEICSKAFRLRNHLVSHLETHNEGHNYNCEHCNQKYKTKTTLRSHITTMHTNVKSFVCSLCSRIFGRRHHLQAHMESHERKMRKDSNLVF